MNFHAVYCEGSQVWEIHDFSNTHILREINFGDSRSTKSSSLTFLEALIEFHEFLHFFKAEIYQINKTQSPQMCKNSSFSNYRLFNVDFT